MDDTRLSLSDCSPSDLSQTLARYIGDCVRRPGWSRGGLGLRAYDKYLVVEVGDGCGRDNYTEVVWFVRVWAFIRRSQKTEETEEICLGVTAHIPRGEVTDFHVNFPISRSSELCGEMHDLTDPHLYYVHLSKWFVELDDRGCHELPCGLDYITVSMMDFGGGGWSSLINFLSRRTAVGRRVSSLRLNCSRSSLRVRARFRAPQEVVEAIKHTVDAFVIGDAF